MMENGRVLKNLDRMIMNPLCSILLDAELMNLMILKIMLELKNIQTCHKIILLRLLALVILEA